ncbi:DMT family transporter [Caldimonas thermodepolymerans]|jgi:drug/metabolite transporter (DMT)-like permease|uniref:Membrane protein n=1 Tax=Caldimonas thermodepolymerans TaxID=215580 RepID=A0AA46HWJ1_9BURK|nr:DMT family transporter [Caldimonas thermodepolymerans]TCP08544.1 putative membrane protein [Caldimonas thermodepolymerans]UZG43206.1 DMT family transporter [Caldimonas thermodepolymerans]UZG46872.1 DMT family transporter [Caldimonas thermodepolymerans]
MKPRDLLELLLLASIWGSSFLFMRIGAGEFGPVALAALRVAGASLLLVPLLALYGQLHLLRRHAAHLAVAGLFSSGLPFLCFSYAALSITAGLSSIFNATTPLFGALVAWVWLKDRPTPWRMVGLAIGFAGVLGLAWDKASFKAGATSTGWAVLACLAATFCYGLSASYVKRHLTGVPSLVVATGTQVAAALFLAVPAAIWWPAETPSARSWGATLALALLCTGVAYIMFFRLIARIGPANAISVTFLVPAFAVLWGWVFLAERVTLAMLLGSAVILLGTALATGLLPRPRQAKAVAAPARQ